MSATNPPNMNIGIKKVPQHVWQRARHNAIASGLAFRDYLIAVLATCTPVDGNAEAKTIASDQGKNGMDVPSRPTVQGNKP
jgi:hypothetical protein